MKPKKRLSFGSVWNSKYRPVFYSLAAWLLVLGTVLFVSENAKSEARAFWFIELIAYIGWILVLKHFHDVWKNQDV